jgi:hypothetical protein
MTAVMRAVRAPDPRARVLRVATLVGGSIVEERIVAAGFVVTGKGSLTLTEDARGKITVGRETILFQLVAPPPPQTRPRLPLSVRTGPAIDWRLTIIVALSFLVHFGFVGSLYADWTDTPVEEGAWVQGIVDMSKLAPPTPVEDRTEPTPTHPSTSNANASNTSANPSANHAAPAGNADPAARAAALSARAEAMQVELLAAFGGESAVQNALHRSNIPTPDLDETARSAGGVRNASDLKLSEGGVLVRPGGPNSLSRLGVTDRDGSDSAGTVRVVDAPTVAKIETIVTSAPVRDADAIIAGLRPSFRACYNRGVAKQPDMQGKIVVAAKIAPNGEVVSTDKADGAGLSDEVESCVMRKIQGASFAPPGPGGATRRIPVAFYTLSKNP